MRILQLLENELLASVQWPDKTCMARLKELNEQLRTVATAADWTPLVRLNRDFYFLIYSQWPTRSSWRK